MPRLKGPRKFMFLCDDCGTVTNFLPSSCIKCHSVHLEEKVINR